MANLAFCLAGIAHLSELALDGTGGDRHIGLTPFTTDSFRGARKRLWQNELNTGNAVREIIYFENSCSHFLARRRPGGHPR
jgi:hypothetical protein